jgi:small-conductance mechanosensitive channel
MAVFHFFYKITSNVFTKKVIAKREQDARQAVDHFFKGTYQEFKQILLEKSGGPDNAEARKLAGELILLRESFLKSQGLQSKLSPDWHKFSKAFYHLAIQCEGKSDEGDKADFETAMSLHRTIRKLLLAKFESGILRIYFILATLMFYVLSVYFTPDFLSRIITLQKSNLYTKLAGPELFYSPIVSVGIGVVVALLIYEIGNFWLRSIVEKTRTDIDDILAGVFIGPISLLFFAFFTYCGYFMFIGQGTFFPLNPIPSSLLLIMATWLAVVIFNRLIIYGLRKITQATEQKYGDMLVILFQIYGTFIIVGIGMGILLFLFRDWFGSEFGIDIMILYSILVSVFSAILGFASKDSLENFLGGALISMDQPFKLGERIMLPDGEICDVIEIGMRTTKLYNVMENTEIYIPNMALSNMKITNFSRPDSELRVQITIYIATGKRDTIKKAESILMDIAYRDLEVDNARLQDVDLTKIEKNKGRISIKDELQRLRILPRVEDAIQKLKEPRTDTSSVSVGKPLDLKVIMEELVKDRSEYKKLTGNDNIVDTKKSFEIRSAVLGRVLDHYQELEEAVAEISDQVPELRDEFHPLISELARDPDAYSQFGVTEDGRSYVQLSLVMFSTHLERRYEVVHKVNRKIEEKFREMGIPLLENHPKDS